MIFFQDVVAAVGVGVHFGLRQNLTLMALERYATPWLRPDAERAALAEAVGDYGIRTGSLDVRASSLSGGNQQKLALAKVLQPRPKVVVLDEPTRGVDVGAKREIYQQLDRFTARGIAILMASSDLPELLALSDRIVVLHRGRVTARLGRAEATPDLVLEAAMGEASGAT